MEELIIQARILRIEETLQLKVIALITLTEDQAPPLLTTELTTIAATIAATIIHPEVIQHQVLHLPVHTTAAEAAAEA